MAQPSLTEAVAGAPHAQPSLTAVAGAPWAQPSRAAVAGSAGAYEAQPSPCGAVAGALGAQPSLTEAVAGVSPAQPSLPAVAGALRAQPSPRRGIFPVVEDEFGDPALLVTSDSLQYQADVESDHAVVSQFDKYMENGYPRRFNTPADLMRHLGEVPVPSLLHIIEQRRGPEA